MKNSEILAEQELRDIYYNPPAGYQSCGKVIPEGKGAKPGREQASGKGLVENPGHVYEIQVYR